MNHYVSLDDIALSTGTDNSSAFHDYMRRLEPFLEPMRDQPICMVEIGVLVGQGSRAWCQYFHKGKVIGIELEDYKWEKPFPDNFELVRGNAGSLIFWQNFFTSHCGPFGFIFDDCGHFPSQIKVSFAALWPRMRSGALYVISDLHSSYLPVYTQGHGNSSAVEWLKTMIDDVNESGADECGKPQRSDIESITFSKSLAILRKR